MVQQVENRGFRPLLVLHSRHLNRSNITKRNAAIISNWISKDLLLQTPAGCNDDWFWLYTAVAIKAKVVTNDEMRDHHFLMLSPKWFSRWKERNQVRFSFGAWVDIYPSENNSNKRRKITNEGGLESQSTSIGNNEQDDTAYEDAKNTNIKGKEALLSIPRRYSHRIQRLNDGKGYYFPAQDSTTWLCCFKYNDHDK